MKFVNLTESGFSESSIIGAIAVNEDLLKSFKNAIESHFDGELMTDVPEADILRCLNYKPIEVRVEMYVNGEVHEHTVEMAENWIYGY